MEWLLAFAVLVCGLIAAYNTVTKGYFPQPFYFDSDDTFRDWFSTAIWAHDKGAYDTWLTVYPPLTFVMLKYMGIPACYDFADIIVIRDCDWLGIVVMHAFYVLNAILVSVIYMRLDRKTALPRAFTITAGMPMLFGLERGNVILMCITCVMLGWGPLIKSTRWRLLFVGLVVNFKIYMIAAVFAQLIRRRWLWVEGATLSIVIVYMVSFLYMGEGNPVELVANLQNFAEFFYNSQASILAIWYPNTFNPLHSVLTESHGPAAMLIGEDLVVLGAFLTLAFMRMGQALVLASMAMAWLRPEVVTPNRLTLLAVALVMITQEASPYTLPIMFYFVFMERWRGWLKPMAISLTYLVSLPGEIVLGSGLWLQKFSYISDQYVVVEHALAIGMFLRPLGLILITALFAIDTMALVVRDIRDDGWQGRWRFHKDAPILPRIRKPIGPQQAID